MHWFSVVCLLVTFGASLGMRNFSCPRVKLKNGHVKFRQRGRFAEFLCNKSFLRAGERLAICVQGEWDVAVPKCVRPTCFPVKPPPNGLIYPSHSGGVTTFYCKHGYSLRGHPIVYCDGKSWDNNSPVCLPSDTKPALSCDFESKDLCHWTHDFNNDFAWTRYKYYTPSGSLSIPTGPSHDHTKQNSEGHYMYIESSSRNTNDWARLISPIYDNTTSNTCFEFFYHMYGTSIGELRVFLKKASQDWSLDRGSAFFIKSGNHGNRWFRSITELGRITEDFQIVIEGVRGDSYISDIAIDDVKLILDCDLTETTSTISTAETCETEKTFIVESCHNRCGAANDTTIPASSSSDVIVCDCDSECYFRSRCCPDYYDVCVFPLTGSTSESTEPTAEYTTQSFTSSSRTETTEFIQPSSLHHNITIFVTERIPPTTETATPEPAVETTTKAATATTSRPTMITTSSTRIPMATKSWSTVTGRPVTTETSTSFARTTNDDYMNTESAKTTVQSNRIERYTLLPFVLKKEVEEGAAVALDTLLNDIEHFTFRPAAAAMPKTPVDNNIHPTQPAVIDDNSEVTEVDEMEVPWQRSDEGSFEEDKTDVERYAERKDQIDRQMKNDMNRDFFSHGKHEELLVKSEPSSIRWDVIIVCCSLVTIVGTIGSVVLYRKYRGWPYSKRILRLRRSRHGSESDVMFLTNDEQLNFTFGYDSL